MREISLWGVSNYMAEITTVWVAADELNEKPPSVFRNKEHYQREILNRVYQIGLTEGARAERERIAGVLGLL